MHGIPYLGPEIQDVIIGQIVDGGQVAFDKWLMNCP